MRNRYFLMGCLLVASLILRSQEALKLKTIEGVYHISSGEFNGLMNMASSYDPVSKHFFGVLHYADIPSEKELETLQHAGVVFDFVLPERAYLVSFPLSAAAAIQQSSAGAFYALPAGSRLSQRMRHKDFPEWMWVEDGKAELQLQIFRNNQWNSQLQRIQEVGFQVVEADKASGTAIVRGFLPKFDALMALPFVQFAMEADAPAEPENVIGRASHRVTAVQQAHPSYDGRGVVVGLGDDGSIGPHIDYQGRILLNKAGASQGNHGDHVAGTIFGAGNKDPRGRGMAPGAEMIYYSYPDNLTDVDQDYVQLGVRITSSSYSNGCNAGYTTFTNNMDQDAIQHRSLLHVFSAGNNGTSNCGYGAGSGWGNITGGHKAGKNVIAVANLTNTDDIASSSSRGPASDGRIKPEVAAIGTDVYSTIENNQYAQFTGTSMACPGVSGVLSVMYSAYQQTHNNNDPAGGLMKAVLMNSSDDLGNPGPDFIYGFGRVNARRAVEVIENDQWYNDTLTNGQSMSFGLTVPTGISEVKVMLYWVDPAASPTAQTALVNDLDLHMVTPDGTTVLPWVLDPTPTVASLNSNAVRAVDSLNNMEQITWSSPNPGTYTLTVDASNIPLGSQEFFLTYEFISDGIVIDYPSGGESFVPFQSEIIRWNAPQGNGNYTVEFTPDDGQNWFTLSSTVSANDRLYTWGGAPLMVTSEARIRITQGGQSTTSNKFNIIPRPGNITVVTACPDSMLLTWNVVNGATHYDVLILGSRYMDSVITVDTNYAVIGSPIIPVNEHWISVRARRDSTIIGQRADAVFKPAGTINCNVQYDLSVVDILSPGLGLQDCQSPLYPKLRIRNDGVQPAFNFTAWANYIGPLGSGNQSVLVTDTLLPGQTMDVALNNPWTLNSSLYTIQGAVVYALDGNPFNDSAQTEVLISFSSGIRPFPYSNDLDSWFNCATSTDCGNTSCSLPDGFQNLSNGIVGGDDIDWRTNSGTTASANTGPSTDYSTGTSAGKYLYLEASNCFGKEAILTSPCIDLSGASLPVFKFWYHMFGAATGELHVDVMAGGLVYPDVVTPIVGNQGNQWWPMEVALADFVGQIINIRIRGITGNDFTSDIAIDHFEWTEVNSPPAVSFNPTSVNSCAGQAVAFFDMSSNSPNQWEWKFFPNTVSFVNGTSANSQNPRVQFNGFGAYNVRLIATNTFGVDSVEVPNAVNILAPANVAVSEDFENLAGGFPPAGFGLQNPDISDTWERVLVGADFTGQSGRAITVNNFNYNASGQEDRFISPEIQMPSSGNIYFRWDIAYAYYSTTFSDGFEVRLSTDCGQTYNQVLYSQSGSALATAGAQTTNWSPTTAADWRRDSVSLNNWLGQSIRLALVNINGYGNNLFIDNFKVYEPGVMAPTSAFFTQSDTNICSGTTVVFSVSNSQAGVNYLWDFGSGAVPATAQGVGPHGVTYSTGGVKSVNLTASNTGGQAQAVSTVNVTQSPIANFTFSQGATYLDWIFTSTSVGSNLIYDWDFGDGNTSNGQNPSHSYATSGTYVVSLTTTSNCGSSTSTETILVSGIGLNDALAGQWSVYPNPADVAITVDFGAINEVNQLRVLDLQGRVVEVLNIDRNARNAKIALEGWASGVYLVELKSHQGVSYRRFQKD